MLIGLRHSHFGLAILIFVLALLNLVFALMPNKSNPAMAKVMKISHSIVLWGGRGNLFFGLGVYFMNPAYLAKPIMEMWWAWLALLLWGPVEAVSKRMIKPDLDYVLEGGQSSKKLAIGFGIELIVVAIIFGMMSHGKG